MQAFFAAPDWLTKDEIAARQVRALREYQDGIRLTDIKRMFEMMDAETPAKRRPRDEILLSLRQHPVCLRGASALALAGQPAAAIAARRQIPAREPLGPP
jgi:hypothetical protein